MDHHAVHAHAAHNMSVDTPVIHGGGGSNGHGIDFSGTVGVPVHTGPVTVTPWISGGVIGGHGGISGGGVSVSIGW